MKNWTVKTSEYNKELITKLDQSAILEGAVGYASANPKATYSAKGLYDPAAMGIL